MKIFILDKYKITKFNLPEKIEESFLIPYNGYNNKNDNFVTVEANEGKWQLKSNSNANVLDEQTIVDKINLNEYGYYNLKILGQEENVILFALPDKDEDSYKLAINKLNSITIGSSINCNISYKNNLTAQVHAELKFINNEWYIAGSSDDKYRTYVNGERILTSKLNVGDVIFINGLKIIWMRTFLIINNPNKSISVVGLSAYEELNVVDNTKYTPVTDEESNVELYDEEDYFYHLPRIVPIITSEQFVIDMPPGGLKKEELPFWLTIGTSLTMFGYSGITIFNLVNSILQKKPILQLLPQIIMAFSMLFGSLIMPRVLKAYQKRKNKQKEKLMKEKYKEYLDKMNTKIQYALKKQTQILKENYLSSKECNNIILSKGRRFWLREIYDDDFLNIRLGIGDIPSNIKINTPQEKFTLYSDNLQDMVFEVTKNAEKLTNVPITLNITEQTILSLIFNCSYSKEYVDSILTQLLALHSALELKIIILTDKKNESRWNFAKFLPHCWSDDKQRRFFSSNQDDAKELSNYLEELYNYRKVEIEQANSEDPVINSLDQTNNINNRFNKSKKVSPYYLIITDNYKLVKRLPIIQNIENSIINYGFSILTISDTMKNIPNRCEKFIQIGEKEGCIFDKRISSSNQIVFQTEYEKTLNMNLISSILANVPLLTKDALTELPTSISFLDIYGVGKIEQLNILNRWQNNSPVSTLSAPIGVHTDGETFKLDLHEKAYGPHGLIAGMTGSGKSEFIITYILSMCLNYHPYEVQFVLIDYKGGGLAGAFENNDTGVRVPHLVGTITNLDTAEMNRALVSISSELKRRQRKFNEVKDKLEEGTMDIYKYQKFYREGLIEEPMAHLFIISDEFAELKSQQPEFLAELVSTARIGRSLGVHLILATQKPSGVVNDQIWSNSKFKICLKVQDRSDSMEMLKRPEAASIREAGRFYLQVGYNDYFDIGQSGWAGAKYVPTDKIVKKIDDSINYINNIGHITKTVNDITKKDNAEDLGEQLTNIVKHIYNLGIKENITTRKMWLDNIPGIIYVNEIKKKYNYTSKPYVIEPVIGEYDDPSSQSQGLLNLSLHGNALIYGKSGSGKENLISTILWSSIVEHTPNEVNFYVIDCGADTLKMFHKMPHVGEVMSISENEKIIDTFNMVSNELARRKDEYADYGGSYINYCENSGNKDPLIVTIINNYDTFVENFYKLSEQIQNLYRDGYKYGLTFIISCMAVNAVRGKMQQNFSEKIMLQMPSKDDYRSVLPAPRGLIPSNFFGRGLIEKNGTAYEFQTAYISEQKNIVNVVRDATKQLETAYTTKAKKIPVIPKIVTLKDFEQENISLDKFPIGFNLENKSIINCNLTKNKFTPIVSENMPSRLNFVNAIIKQLKNIQNINLKIVDFVNVLNEEKLGVKVYNSNYDNIIVQINNEIANENQTDVINFYVIVGLGEFETELSDGVKQVLNNLFMASNNFNKSYFMLIDNYSSYRKLQLTEWYKKQIGQNNGVWLGPNLGNQMAFNVGNLSMEIRRLDFPHLAFLIENNSFSILKYVIEEEEQNEK